MNDYKDYANYSTKENLKVVFSFLIFNVESVEKRYGSLFKFTSDFKLVGQTNGKLYISCEMTSPYPYDLSKLVDERIRWTGLKEQEDYVFGNDYLVNGAGGYVTPLLNCEIPELKEIKWLGSIITRKGNYVWHVNNLNQKSNNYLTFQENQMEGKPPIKLLKYKYLRESPKVSDMSVIKIVHKYEFTANDHLIPLLVCDQHQIYPNDFKDLKLLRGKKIALIGKSNLSGYETNIEEYFLDDFTIFLLTFSSVNLIYREYYEENKYNLKLKNYWQ